MPPIPNSHPFFGSPVLVPVNSPQVIVAEGPGDTGHFVNVIHAISDPNLRELG